jgi:hypothetical protein
VGTGNSLVLAQTISQINWTEVPLAEGLLSVTELYPATQTGSEQDITQGTGGQVYVLDAYAGNNQALLHRFEITPVSANNLVAAKQIIPFNDLDVEDVPSYFLIFENFQNYFATVGLSYLSTRDKTQGAESELLLLLSTPSVGHSAIGLSARSIATLIGLGNEIQSLQRNNASGSWLLAGSFGLRVNE